MFRLAELTRYALWYDELFSVTVAQGGWGELFRAAVADRTNPPLFYVALKLWMAVGGDSPAWLRLLPCLAGIATAVPLVALARRAFVPLDSVGATPRGDAASPLSSVPHSRLAAVATIAVAAGSPLLVALSNEIRAYSFLLLFTALSMVAFARVARAATGARSDAPPPSELRNAVAWLVVADVALVYTHYFGWLVVAAEFGAAVFWNRCAVKPALLATAAAAVAFAPWALVVVSAAGGATHPLQNVDWISRPSPGDVPVFYDALIARVITPRLAFLGAVIVVAPLVALAIAMVRAGRRAKVTRHACVLLWFALVPVIAVYAVSVLGNRSLFVPRYLVVAAPAWWLLVGMASVGLGTPAWARPQAFLAAATFSAFTLTAGVMREVRGGEKIPWDAVVASIAKDAGPAGGTVYSLEGFTALPLTYYAAGAPAPLTVRPVRELASIQPPAWLVVRSTPGDSSTALGAALRPTGVTLRLVSTSAILSQRVAVYRVERP